jgi:hypothetical protein
MRDGVIRLYDNVTPHTALQTQQWFQQYGLEVLQHSTHRTDLVPSDFHLFGPLKRHLLGQQFVNDDDTVAMTTWL